MADGEHAGPRDEGRGGQPRAQLLGEVRRRHPDRAVAVRADAHRTRRRRRASGRATTGVTSTTPGDPWRPWSGATRSPRPSTSAGPPARKNGTSEPSRAAAASLASSSSSAPHASSAASTVAAASDDPPARPAATGIRFSRRAASAGAGRGRPASPADRGAGYRQRAQDEVVGRRPRVAARDMERVAVATDGREAEPVGQGQRHEDRVEGVVAVVAAADDGERQVELRRCEANDRGEASERVGHGRRLGRAARAATVRPDRAERVVERQPLPDRERLRPAIGAIPAVSRAPVTRPASSGS